MAQNLMLEYAGGTPQTALTGVTPRGMTPERETIASTTGALQERPDIADSYIRGRALANQSILQSIIDDRMADAQNMSQHKHDP